MNNLITLKEYLDKGKTFVIPNYQRGYIWGKLNKSDKNSVEFILDTIKLGFSKETDVFLQGMTVSESPEIGEIELIDGQQRTVFFYLLLCYLGYNNPFNIRYAVREKSESFLVELNKKNEEELLNLSSEIADEEYQDLFFLKKTLRIINSELRTIDKKELLCYLLTHIKFLYINIPKDKAIKTFTMMNGSKAIMLPEELVKAEMLRQISLNSEDAAESLSKEWEINALRSRYAREWDKWLYWWNRDDVKYFFKVKNPMGLLLEYYYLNTGEGKVFSFDHFKALLSDKNTKKHFKGLRDLQKSFEYIYNDHIIYNLLGVSLRDCGDDTYKIIRFFTENKHNLEELSNFAKWRIVGATFKQITEPEELSENEDTREETHEEARKDKAQMVLDTLNQRFVYESEGDGFARKYLLYLNILEDNKANDGQGRKFNFHIFDKQSLEHIHPKSKAFHKEGEQYKTGNGGDIIETQMPCGDEWLNRDECPENISEHSIGNLVLLDGNDNSTFGNKTFNEKKNIYFDLEIKFRSRDLLHTISVFAKEKWGKDEIIENQNNIISGFKNNYGI
jgi:hypothetical protein